MIREILDREFVLKQLSLVQQDLESAASSQTGPERRGSQSMAPPTPEDYQEAFAAVKKSQEDRRSGGASDEPFFVRDPAISLLQTALELYVQTNQESAIEVEKPSDGDRRGVAEEIAITSHYLNGNDPKRRIFNKFSVTDIRWVSALVAQGIRAFRGKHAFVPPPDQPVPIGEKARLILVGDWGTGIPRALKVSKRIREIINEGKGNGIEQHVIHLGDVYYSGWDTEYKRRFLAPGHWPVELNEAEEVGSWCLNGNHDMYSGGHAYFDVLLADSRFRRQAGSSCFGLQNRHWEILGLDTAYEDEALRDPQADWVKGRAHDSTRKLLLLSHHQIVSAYEEPCTKLRDKMKDVLATGHVQAWFWGHEHRCALYIPEAEPMLQFARCLGNGGVPAYMPRRDTDPIKAPAEYEFRGKFATLGGLEEWSLFGFAVLDFDGAGINVRYVDENGVVFRRERIS